MDCGAATLPFMGLMGEADESSATPSGTIWHTSPVQCWTPFKHFYHGPTPSLGLDSAIQKRRCIALVGLTDWIFWNCADVRVRLVGGVEKVCPWGGMEVQDTTPLQGDCSPDRVSGVCGTQRLKVPLKAYRQHRTSAEVLWRLIWRMLIYTRTALVLQADRDRWLPAVQWWWRKLLSLSQLQWLLQRQDDI